MNKKVFLGFFICLTLLNLNSTRKHIPTKRKLDLGLVKTKNIAPQEKKSTTSNTDPKFNPEFKPVMIIELFSNGAASPTNKIKQRKLDTFYSDNDELLATGMRQHFNLGQAITTKYNGLFLETDSQYRHKYKMVSIEKHKSIESAYSHLLGMYGSTKSPTLNQKHIKDSMFKPVFKPQTVKKTRGQRLKKKSKSRQLAVALADVFAIDSTYKPFKVETKNLNHDHLLFGDMSASCPNLHPLQITMSFDAKNQIQNDILELTKRQKHNSYGPNDIFQLKQFTVEDQINLYDSFRSYLYYHGKLPYLQDEIAYKELEMIHSVIKYSMFKDMEINKFFTSQISEFVNKAIEKKISAISSKNQEDTEHNLNYIGLSGSDFNIAAFLINLNKTSLQCQMNRYNLFKKMQKVKNPGPGWSEDQSFDNIYSENPDDANACLDAPKFGDNLIWELSTLKNKKDYYVRLLYNGKDLNVCKTDSGYCRLEDYMRINKYHFINDSNTNYDICGFNKDFTWANDIFYGLLVLCLFLLISLVCLYSYYKSLVGLTMEIFAVKPEIQLEDLEARVNELEEKYLQETENGSVI